MWNWRELFQKYSSHRLLLRLKLHLAVAHLENTARTESEADTWTLKKIKITRFADTHFMTNLISIEPKDFLHNRKMQCRYDYPQTVSGFIKSTIVLCWNLQQRKQILTFSSNISCHQWQICLKYQASQQFCHWIYKRQIIQSIAHALLILFWPYVMD